MLDEWVSKDQVVSSTLISEFEERKKKLKQKQPIYVYSNNNDLYIMKRLQLKHAELIYGHRKAANEIDEYLLHLENTPFSQDKWIAKENIYCVNLVYAF